MGGLLVAPRPELDAQVDVAISPQLPVSLIDAGLKARWSLALRPPSYLGGRFQISRYQSQLILPSRYLRPDSLNLARTININIGLQAQDFKA